ncbi:patatin-like phospholipase family protein [Streptomyces sp. NPDC006314]|uniref:patatin-like phospholipase family protein n=1 Tax=Streptomyces sp. NPDC006314 TaxID=3154475 RepID=UPI0033B8C515
MVETGEQKVFDRASGASLPSAVAASTAFPGIYPPITINGRRYMDGSLQSATNAGLAAGARILVVIDPQAHLFPPSCSTRSWRSPGRTRR